MSRREVVVTGIGLDTPHGPRAATWQSVLGGQRWAFAFLAAAHPGPTSALSEALADAGLSMATCGPAPLIVGSSKGGVGRIGDPRLNGGFWHEVPAHATGEELARSTGWGGPVRMVSAACASGALAVGLAASAVANGESDIAMAGGVEESLSPLLLAGYERLGVLSPDGVCRPFDRRRRGFVPSAGSGFVVLESAERAAARGARVYATLAGWAAGSDTSHAVAFDGAGAAVERVVRAALKRAGLRAADLAYVNAHGTGTVRNDVMEARGLGAALGPEAVGVPVSSTKGCTGHLLGAAGAVEWGLTLLALSTGVLPPTAGLEEPDPECRLNLIHGSPAEAAADRPAALSLSFGFGGAVVALVALRNANAHL